MIQFPGGRVDLFSGCFCSDTYYFFLIWSRETRNFGNHGSSSADGPGNGESFFFLAEDLLCRSVCKVRAQYLDRSKDE